MLLPLYLIRIVLNMLGFVGSGFDKSSKDFQVICRNCNRSFENAEKNWIREKKAACERPYVGNIAETILPNLEEYQEKSEQALVHRQH